jgi:hypothetical protein
MWPQNSVKLKACASSDLPITYTFVDKFACALSSNVLSIAQPGRCTIRATQPGNGSYAPAAPVTREFVVDPQVVSASWVNPPGSVTVGQKVVLELRVTSPSGPVTHGYINVVAYGDGDLCSGRMESRASSDGIARLDLQTVSSGTCTVTGSVNADAYVHGTNVTALSIKVVDGSSTP